MKKNGIALCLALGVLAALPAAASSHREALTVLNEPCADNTDTYAWVKPGDHSKLYLVMSYNPLHEPGQGNQGFRSCNGYRYEFHVGMGTSIADKAVYRVEFKNSLAPEAAPSPTDGLGGGNELLWQISGGSETYTVTRVMAPGHGNSEVLGDNLPVLPNNHGPQTDRLVYHLGDFHGYDSGDPTSREQGLYDQNFVDTYIQSLSNGGRIIAGDFDDAYQLDEKGIFDLVNLGRSDLGGITGARRTPIEDVFTGFNVSSIALELPITELFPGGIPHNGTLVSDSTDALLRVWVSISRRQTQTVDPTNVITGVKGSGRFVQVGRNALPLFNAGLIGAARHTVYLHSTPLTDVSNFANEILFPVIVRDADALGIYKALGLDQGTVDFLKGGMNGGGRVDIIQAVNLGRPIPIADGSTGDVITLDASTDSSFPNGRRIGGGPQANMHNANVNSITLSLIAAGNPGAGLFKGVETNDKDFNPNFPFLAPPHQGLEQGHGGINNPPTPVVPDPLAPQPCQ
jgi:hypothetical protein